MSQGVSNPYLYFDETDPSFVYSDGWTFTTHALADTGLSGLYNDTLAGTITPQSTVHIEFIASQIAIIGATFAPAGASSDAGPVSTYVLDDSLNQGFVYQGNATNATQVIFFISDNLEQTHHTLDITVLSASQGLPYLLDVIALKGTEETAVPTTAVWVTTVFATPTAAPDHLATGAAESSAPLPVGAIVGGVVGGVALIVAAALAFFFLYWRRRHYGYRGFSHDALFDAEKDHLTSHAPGPEDEHAAQIVPFLTPGAGAAAPQYSDTASAPTPRASEFGASALSASAPPAAAHVYPPPASLSSGSAYSSASRTLSVANNTDADAAALLLTPAQRKAREAEARRRPVQYYADSGVRFDSGGRPVEASGAGASGSHAHEEPALVLSDVPPEYSET